MTFQVDHNQIRRSFASGKSVWRSMMNAHAALISPASPVLDLGAGAAGTASYHEVIPGFSALEVYSVDIDGSKNPTKIADIEKGIPFAEPMFRSCIAFNLLEHLFAYDTVLREISRVLLPGGTLYLAVPFLMRVHGDPSDYFRYTAFALERILTSAGFTDIQIIPCGYGALTAALSQVDFAVPRLLRGLALRTAIALDKLITRRSGGKYRNANDYALGYVVIAHKASNG